MDNKRIHLMFIVGSNEVTADDMSWVYADISKLTGGLTATECRGYWSEQGEFNLSTYGNLKDEKAYRVDVTVVSNDLDELLPQLKDAFRFLKGKAEWIHLEMWDTMADHFQI